VQVDGGPGIFSEREHYYFKGANAHQDHAGWGDAVADSGFTASKAGEDAGFDFLRGSHYPHAPAFADACDRLAFFSGRNCFWGTAGFKNPWGSSAYRRGKVSTGFDESVKNSLRT